MGCLGLKLQDKMQRWQNRATHTITRRGYDYRSVNILNELELPNESVKRNIQTTNMYNNVSGKQLLGP